MEDDMNNGWDDDWDIESDDDDDDVKKEETNVTPVHHSHNPPPPPPPPQQDEELSGDKEEEENVKELLLRYLKQVEDFPLSSLKRKDDTMFFSEEEALDLYAYYKERPELVNYTIDMEVPRMKYRVICTDGNVVTEVPEIQQVLRESSSQKSSSMLLRASNQSILADVLPALSQRGLVWNDSTSEGSSSSALLYQMCPIAKSCQFVLDLDANTVHVDCTLHVQLPILSFPLSEIRISIQFHPHVHFPTLSYQVVSTKSLIDPTTDENISSICQLLETEHAAMTTTTTTTISTEPQKSSHGRRDDFIHQILQKNSLAVWNDIDAVVNVSSKLQFLKSSFLPNYQQEHDTTSPTQEPLPERPPSIVMGGFGLLSAGISKLVQTNETTTTGAGTTNPYAFPRPPTTTTTTTQPLPNKVPPPPPPPTQFSTTDESTKFNTPQRRVPPPPPPPIQTRKDKTPTKVSLPPPPPPVEEEDGWSFQDEDDLDVPIATTPKSSMTTSLTMDHAIQINHPEDDDYYNVPKDFEYNPINGIIPTRKRFNPQSYRMLGFVKSQ